MKILIRTVLLAISVLINFHELNSSSVSNEEGLLKKVYRRPKIIIKDYMEREFAVTLDFDNYTPVACNLVLPRGIHQILPDLEYRKHHNYVTRALIRGHIRCVVFIEGDGRVLGAKLPPSQRVHVKSPKDHPCRLNPDDTKWYITYDGLDYEVKDTSGSGYVQGIQLLPANIIPTQEFRDAHDVKTVPVKFAGLYFLLHIRRDIDKIVGAQLDPYWRSRTR